MAHIINISETMIFDEYEWGNDCFHPNELAITLLEQQLDDIDTITFLSADKMINIVMKPIEPHMDKHKSYYFRPSLDTLNHFCKIPGCPVTELLCQRAVKKYIAWEQLSNFSVIQYPFLAALILGK